MLSWQTIAISAAVVALAYALGVVVLIVIGRRTEARALARFVPDCLVLMSRLLRDRRVSRARKVLVVVTLGYLAMPVDLVPDFIPIAGQLDDAGVFSVWPQRTPAARGQLRSPSA